MKMIAINKHSSKLNLWGVGMPSTPYLNHYSTLKTIII
jgi:hypothetical protein